MNTRKIRQVLKAKHQDFLNSIEDDSLRKAIHKDAIITGGSIASMFLNENISDFDYYFKTKATALQVAIYYTDKFNEMNPDIDIKPEVQEQNDRIKIIVKSAGIVSEDTDDSSYQYFEGVDDDYSAQEYVEQVITDADNISGEGIDELRESKKKPKYRPVFLSANAITLSDKVQLVIRFHGNPEEIHKNYDFVHVCNYWAAAENKLVTKKEALESLLAKHLYYQGSLYPLCSIIRTRKFLKKGWYINAGQILKMCFQLSELDLTNISVLEEQLTGVDAAYFHEVISYCKKRQDEDPNWKIDSTYLCSIVDKIFG